MRRECIIIWRLTLIFLLLHSASFHTGVEIIAEETGHEYSKGCAHLRCERGSSCIKRRFWCKNPPCPGMLYCTKSWEESLKGPFTCDTVRCSSGHICVVRVRGCRWNEKCQQIARCVSEKEYREGETSCAGFECPEGKRCILCESHCVSPPCKLVRSCAEAKKVQIWLDKCKVMDCLSEYECFLRKPVSYNNCIDTSCAYTPDCTLTTEDELISKYCRGWICPRMQKCMVRIVGSCKGFDCTIERYCRSLTTSANSSTEHDIFTSDQTERWSTKRTLTQIETGLTHQEAERREMNTPTRYPITRKKTTSPATSTRKQTDYTTSHEKHGTEISVIHQRTTAKSSSVIEPPDTSSARPHSITYPRSSSNPDELLTTTSTIGNGLRITDEGDNHATTSRLSGWSGLPAIPAFNERSLESTIARDTTGLELLKKIYIAADDAVLSLPVVLEGINLVGQGYPVWQESELHRAAVLAAESEDENGWKYYAPREPYRILLPPYEPVILVEDTRGRGQLSPFFTYALGHPFNEATLLSLQEISSRGATRNSKVASDSASVVDGISSDANVSATIEMGNFRTNYFDDSPDDYANVRAIKKTDIVTPNIRDRQSGYNYYDGYEWRPWHVIRDYLEKSAPQSVHEKEPTSGTDEFATDNLRRNETWADVETFGGDRVAHENRDWLSDRQSAYRHNKNLATPDPIRAHVPTGHGDYSSEDGEERYGLVNYPYGTIAVHDVDKSRGDRGSSLDRIVDISRDQESVTFSFGELDKRRNERSTTAFLHETSPYRIYDDNDQKNDRRKYNEYYSHYESRQH